MIKPINKHIRPSTTIGFLHDSRGDVRRLAEVSNILIDKLNEVIDKVNELDKHTQF